MIRPYRGLRLARAWTTAPLVGACLALQFSATIHLALVEHRLCAEHGEVIDADDQPAHTHLGADAQGHANDAVASARSLDGAHGLRHDHCPITADRNSRALLVASASVGVLDDLVAEVPRPHACGFLVSACALRLLAPKTSPPA